ncbi:MAG: NAD(P)/FAD-dependent oxidoreductase [Candidatus Omnitrophota bacterium]|jgi:hypothetical protein
MNPFSAEIVIVGGGAAGLMAAAFLGEAGRNVLLLNATAKLGSKILISGGTRCNVTNLQVTEKDYHGGSARVIRNILRTFPEDRAVRFFEDCGVELVPEKDGKLFPKTQSARTVLDALLARVRCSGKVTIETGRKITGISSDEEGFSLHAESWTCRAKTVILCTGGLSYPETGCDGSGYRLAKSLGHTIVPTLPALTPLLTKDPDWTALMGLALPCRLSVKDAAKKEILAEGPVLFTHTGFSGPAVLDISCHWPAAHALGRPVSACFLPEISEEEFRGRLARATEDNSGKSIKNYLLAHFPERLALTLLKKTGVEAGTVLNQLKKTEREKVLETLYRYPLPVSATAGYSKAEVTAGGVSLEEVDPHTLESKKAPGLFFAGEMLDVDGRLGGFNFQWAWSSAVAVARALAARSIG